MGLGLKLIATPPRSGLLKRRRFELREVLEAFKAALEMPEPLDRLVHYEGGLDTASAHLSPLTEPVKFRVDGAGRLVATANTSSVGPGYHRVVVEALAALATAERFTWGESVNSADPTGYFLERDFSILQQEFAWDLARLSRRLTREAGGVDIALPADLVPLDHPGFARTLRGPRERPFFEETATPDTVDFNAADYYPWWDETLTPRSRLGIAEALAWVAFPWRAGLYERERAVGEVIRALASDAPAEDDMAARLSLPELDALLDAPEDTAPRPDGPGYMRGRVRRPLTGDWQIALPGHFTSQLDPGSARISYWFMDREVHATTYTAAEQKLDLAAEADAATGEFSEIADEHLYVADLGRTTGEDWNAFELEGRVRTLGGLAVISILFEAESDRDWALETFRSIRLYEDRKVAARSEVTAE